MLLEKREAAKFQLRFLETKKEKQSLMIDFQLIMSLQRQVDANSKYVGLIF